MKIKLYACAFLHYLHAAQDLKPRHLIENDLPFFDTQYCQIATAPKDDESENESKTVPVSPVNNGYSMAYPDHDKSEVTVVEERLDNVFLTYKDKKISPNQDGIFLLDDSVNQYLHISKGQYDANRMINNQNRISIYIVESHQIPDGERDNIRTNLAICYRLNDKIIYRPFLNGRGILKDVIGREVMFFNNTTGIFSQALWDLKDKINFILTN